METATLSRPMACRHARIAITTDRPAVFVDLTSRIEAIVAETGVHTGFVNVQTMHTTTAIVVNEHEPLLLADFLSLLERLAPRLGPYRHHDAAPRPPDDSTPSERPNGHAHCRALVLCPSVLLNVAGSRLQLGCWQRVFLAELDGPQTREVSVLVAGEVAR
jgi:secondary thiamine-phosphate synthase enzyme